MAPKSFLISGGKSKKWRFDGRTGRAKDQQRWWSARTEFTPTMSQDENATSSGSSCWTDVPRWRRRWKISALPSLKKMPAAFPLISRLPYQSTDCADSHVWRTYLKSVAENLDIERRSSALWIEMFGSIALQCNTWWHSEGFFLFTRLVMIWSLPAKMWATTI